MKPNTFFAGFAVAALLSAGSSPGWAQPLDPHVSFLPTEEDWALFTTANNNHDGYSWGIVDETKTNHRLVFSSQTALSPNADSSRPYDDWLFLPAISFPDANALYEFRLQAARGTFSQYYGKDEIFEVKAGVAPNAQAMTLTIMGQTHIGIENNKDGKLIPFEQVFGVPEAGTYYIGIHAMTSDSSAIGIYVADVSLEMQQTTVAAPDAVASLTATAAPGAQLTASAVFHMPSHDIAGNPLPESTEIRAVAASAIGSKETTGAPGEVCVISGIPTEQGVNTITVTTYIDDNGGRSASTEVYTGVSIPGAVTNTRCTASADNLTLRFEWDPATIAADGLGAVLPTGNSYVVYEELMNNIMGMDTYYWSQLCELEGDVTSYEISVPDDGLQRKVKIGVIQKNAAGMNNQIVTPITGLGGRPYQLPMMEDFAHCSATEFTYNPLLAWEPSPEYYGQTWTVNDPAIIDQKYNVSHKPVLIFSNHIGTMTRVAIPKFSTEGLSAPTVKMAIYMGEVTPDLSLHAMAFGDSEWSGIGDIAIDRTKEGYGIISMPLGEAFADKPWVYLAVDGYFDPQKYQIGFISEYTVVNSLSKDVGILALEGESPTIGRPEEYKVSLFNPGLNDCMISSIGWKLNRGGETIAEGSVVDSPSSIESMEICEFGFSITARPEDLGQAELVVTVNAEEDDDLNNNSASLPLMIKSDGRVLVSDLRAEKTDSGVVLTWTEPAANHYTEGFEQETPFEREIDRIAMFDNMDADGYQCWNFGEKDPIGGAPQAWTVWNQKQLKQTFGLVYEAASGDQFLMVRCPGDELSIPPRADDWLISPEINGLSYIRFKARPISILYGPEDLEIMYSTEGTAISDFRLLEKMSVKPVLEAGTSSMEDKLVYTAFSTELPADARRFALHYVSHDAFGMMVDDLEYAPASSDRGIHAYEIRRDGEIIATLACNGRYEDTGSTGGVYTVRPLTDGDRGMESNEVYVEGSSANALSECVISVVGIKDGIKLTASSPSHFEIFDVAGKRIASGYDTSATIETAPGLYLVKAGIQTFRVIVR